MDGSTDLLQLASRLSNARKQVAVLQLGCLGIEREIIGATGFSKTEGRETFAEDVAGGSYKLVLDQPINTTVDSDEWAKLKLALPKDHAGRKVFVTKYVITLPVARDLQKNNKAAWQEIASVITRKPGKVSVKVEELVFSEASS